MLVRNRSIINFHPLSFMVLLWCFFLLLLLLLFFCFVFVFVYMFFVCFVCFCLFVVVVVVVFGGFNSSSGFASGMHTHTLTVELSWL